MLGFVVTEDRTSAHAAMADFAMTLMADGWRLAGVVQTDLSQNKQNECDVVLSVLGHHGPAIRISQPLGPGAKGCRLDPDRLERAVAMVARQLTTRTDLLIINKFGKQEALGRGFRQVIADAIAEEVPVLLTVAPEYLVEFLEFAGDIGQQLDWPQVEIWARRTRSAAA